MSQLDNATPQRPWKATPKENLYPASLILLSAVASGVLVKTTGFNGKLGFVALFFFLATASMFFYKFRISGKAAAIDSIASSVMLTAALAAIKTSGLPPWLSFSKPGRQPQQGVHLLWLLLVPPKFWSCFDLSCHGFLNCAT